MKQNRIPVLASLTLGAILVLAAQGQTPEAKLDRTHLPMRNTARSGLVTYDAKNPDSKFPPIEQLRPPKGAPNVLIVLNHFNGEVKGVELSIADDPNNSDHLVNPEDAIKAAMGRQ